MADYKLNIEVLPAFLLGGKANFVVKEIDNDNHIEFDIKRDNKNKDIYYVKFKSIEWEYLGLIKNNSNDNSLPIFIPNKNLNSTKPIVIQRFEVFKKLFLYIYYLNKLPTNIEITYTGICSVCRRKLTDPQYISIGIGKICLQKEW